MRPMAAVERFLERVFERPGARLFDARVEPISLVHRLERAIDEGRRPGPEGPVAPTRFRIGLHARDLEVLAQLPNLPADLATSALDHARHRGYRIPERPTVELVANPEAGRGTVSVASGFADAALARKAPVAQRLDRTMAHPSAGPALPLAVLRAIDPSGRWYVLPVESHPLTIGRARDNEMPLDDPMASRHHARITPRSGRLLLADLGSTNGTAVNGRAIREAVLGVGDLLEIGGSRVEVLAPEAAVLFGLGGAPDDPGFAQPAPEPAPAQAPAPGAVQGSAGAGEWPWMG